MNRPGKMKNHSDHPSLFNVLKKWLDNHFADEEALLLLAIIAAGLFVIVSMGGVLAPLLASLVLAYLLQGLVSQLEKRKIPNGLAVVSVTLLFIGASAVGILLLLPLIWRQLMNLLQELPRMIESGQKSLMLLPEKYPDLISSQQLESILGEATKELAMLGQNIVSISVASLPNFLAILVYLILVPILIFFLLKDKAVLMHSMAKFFPEKRPLLQQVWNEMHEQIANYVRGKAVEILLISASSIIAFQLLGLKYAMLMGVLVGLSVIIPYIGATIVTIPVLLVAYFQWGLGNEFWWLFFAYAIIQTIDGNVLVPLLFSEVVNLHPVVIIMAVLFFGGLWGFWGVFFAIPLATLIKAVMRAWPDKSHIDAQIEEKIESIDEEQVIS